MQRVFKTYDGKLFENEHQAKTYELNMCLNHMVQGLILEAVKEEGISGDLCDWLEECHLDMDCKGQPKQYVVDELMSYVESIVHLIKGQILESMILYKQNHTFVDEYINNSGLKQGTK